jgi:glycosyltransferase involved in cell wall biosynthesis
MRRLAVVHPELKDGGGEGVCFWTIEALQSQYDVTLITSRAVDVAKVNEFYGTALHSGAFTLVQPPLLSFLRTAKGFWLAKQHLMIRHIKRLGSGYDLMISTANEMDLGSPGVQYIHFPLLREELLRELDQMAHRWYYRKSPPRDIYRALCRSLSGFSQERMKHNLTLVNSNWTGKMVQAAYGIETRTLYPPVFADSPCVPWEEREPGFICLGRISAEKQIERAIEIIDMVRAKGWNVPLHIVGTVQDRRYGERIEAICAQNPEWLFLHRNLARHDLSALVARHRYGIHAMPHEHFGMAIAEMVKGGSIVFVPQGGGQVEIVESPLLTYISPEDAAQKIITVLGDSHLQQRLRMDLQQRAEGFSTDHFMTAMRDVVAECLHRA